MIMLVGHVLHSIHDPSLVTHFLLRLVSEQSMVGELTIVLLRLFYGLKKQLEKNWFFFLVFVHSQNSFAEQALLFLF